MEGPGKAGRWPTADEGPEFVAYQGIDDTMVCEDVWEDPPSTSPSSASRPEIEECVLLHSLPSSAAVQVQGMPESHRHAHPNDDLLLDFVAAGVLPYTRGEGGEILFFFGKELSRGCTLSGKSKYVWSDFGGKREGLHETAGETASREFSEETLGLWGGMGSLDDRIAASISATTELIRHIPAPGSFVLKNGLYVSYILEMCFIEPLLFQLARDDNDATLPNGGIKREGDDSVPIRSAEKRDWSWVDAQELLQRVEEGSCRVRDLAGQRLHLLPRLAITLRNYLRHLLDCVASSISCLDLLVVPLDTTSRCLHAFGVRQSLTVDGVRSVLSNAHDVESVTAYKDRTDQCNLFILFHSPHAATQAMLQLRAPEGQASVWECGTSCALEYAWFEGILEDTRQSGMQVYDRKKHTSRLKKLGVGPSTAPWAKKRAKS